MIRLLNPLRRVRPLRTICGANVLLPPQGTSTSMPPTSVSSVFPWCRCGCGPSRGRSDRAPHNSDRRSHPVSAPHKGVNPSISGRRNVAVRAGSFAPRARPARMRPARHRSADRCAREALGQRPNYLPGRNSVRRLRDQLGGVRQSACPTAQFPVCQADDVGSSWIDDLQCET
jgi:hypothetical protein